MVDSAGRSLTSPQDIACEVMHFYSNLVGQLASSITGLDIEVLRAGKQLSQSDGIRLIRPVTNGEIVTALNQIGDSRAPSIDGFNAKFFKASWHIVGD